MKELQRQFLARRERIDRIPENLLLVAGIWGYRKYKKINTISDFDVLREIRRVWI